MFITNGSGENFGPMYLLMNEKEIITPDILLCYPEDNINIYKELLDFVCPNGTQIYDENSPGGEITYHPIILTNQNGNRYF